MATMTGKIYLDRGKNYKHQGDSQGGLRQKLVSLQIMAKIYSVANSALQENIVLVRSWKIAMAINLIV